jgi:hypothetical protein
MTLSALYERFARFLQILLFKAIGPRHRRRVFERERAPKSGRACEGGKDGKAFVR